LQAEFSWSIVYHANHMTITGTSRSESYTCSQSIATHFILPSDN
jgi:hypothetical protein